MQTRFFVLVLSFFCIAFRSPEVSTFSIYLDKTRLSTNHDHKQEAIKISAGDIRKSDSLFVDAFLCGSDNTLEHKTALVIKTNEGKEIAKFVNRARMGYSAGMPAKNLFKFQEFKEGKPILLYLQIFPDKYEQHNLIYMGKIELKK